MRIPMWALLITEILVGAMANIIAFGVPGVDAPVLAVLVLGFFLNLCLADRFSVLCIIAPREWMNILNLGLLTGIGIGAIIGCIATALFPHIIAFGAFTIFFGVVGIREQIQRLPQGVMTPLT